MAKADGKNLEKLIENKFYCAKDSLKQLKLLLMKKMV